MRADQIDAYLARIRFEGDRAPTLATLAALHRAHLLEVPFENLDIHRGRRIVLTEEALFDKIVRRRRGGFCYELNGLFAVLLEALGFRVTRLSAGVHGEAGFGPELDHLALLVELDERFLVDVGFGDSFLAPLAFDTDGEQREGARAYRLRDERERRVLFVREGDGPFEPSFSLSLAPRAMDEFLGMCDFHQTSPSSHFTQRRVCSRATPRGRVTLRDAKLLVTEDGVKSEMAIACEEEHRRALLAHFGVALD